METDAEEPLQRKTSRNKEAEAAITLVGEKRSSHSCKEASKQASKPASHKQQESNAQKETEQQAAMMYVRRCRKL